MSVLAHAGPYRARQRGVGMVEMMVGILIGMIVIVVVYNVLSVAERYKRTAIGASDAQVTGLLTQFVAGRDAGNGGAGITMSTTTWTGSTAAPADLMNCTRNEAGGLISALPVTSLDAGVSPIPVLITDGGAAGVSDSFISLHTGASHVIWPVDFRATAAPGAPIRVQSPNGFTVPIPTAAAPYWVIAMTNDGTGTCKMLRVTAAVPDPGLPPTGQVTLTQDGATATTVAYTVALPARLLNLGPQGLATRLQYDVDGPNAVLRTTDLLTTNALVANPIAQNVVLMKVQYGIDTTVPPDGTVDCWTPADASACGDWSAARVRAAPELPAGAGLAVLNRILAVRIGIVVRGDEPDLRLLTDPGNVDLQAEFRALRSGTRPQVVLFNCSADTNAACQSRVVVPMGGTPTGLPICAPAVICDYWRYRTYETVIPLRNAIFAATMPP